MERNLRKERVGIVTSDKMDKTVVVTVEMKAMHPLYKKTVTTSKKYNSLDETEKGNHLYLVNEHELLQFKMYSIRAQCQF